MAGASLPLVALTAGEPAGIGPDLCVLLAAERFPGRLVIVGDASVLRSRARARGIAFDPPPYPGRATAPALSVLPIAAPAPVVAGRLDAANGRHVLALIDRALEGARKDKFDALIVYDSFELRPTYANCIGINFTRFGCPPSVNKRHIKCSRYLFCRAIIGRKRNCTAC